MPVKGQKGVVMEYGRETKSSALALREKEMENTMAQFNAVYTLLWKKGEDGDFRVVEEYTLASRKRFSFLKKYVLLVFLHMWLQWPDISIISDAYGSV